MSDFSFCPNKSDNPNPNFVPPPTKKSGVKSCERCIHYEICKISHPIIVCMGGVCGFYKDKACFIELPCKFGDTVYVLTNKYRTELEVRPAQIFRISYAYTKEKSEIWISAIVRMVDIASYTGMFQFNDRAFATKKEAEKALKERSKK